MKIEVLADKFNTEKPYSEKVLSTENFMVVHFYLKKGQKIPLHVSKSEVLVTVLYGKGKFFVENGETFEILNENESFFYKREQPHGFEAISDMIVQAVISPNPQQKIRL